MDWLEFSFVHDCSTIASTFQGNFVVEQSKAFSLESAYRCSPFWLHSANLICLVTERWSACCPCCRAHVIVKWLDSAADRLFSCCLNFEYCFFHLQITGVGLAAEISGGRIAIKALQILFWICPRHVSRLRSNAHLSFPDSRLSIHLNLNRS